MHTAAAVALALSADAAHAERDVERISYVFQDPYNGTTCNNASIAAFKFSPTFTCMYFS